MAKKKIAIVGAGAVGCYAGAHMVQAGEDVTYIDPWPENVEAIRNEGLRVTHIRDVEPFTVKPRALHLTEAQQLAKEAPIDIAFVCMKSYDTAWATAMIKQYLAPGGYVVSLQNCMNEETIAGIVGWGKTLGSIASSITVELHAPGQVRRAAGKSGSRHTVFRVGEVHGRKTDRAQEVCQLVSYADDALARVGILVHHFPPPLVARRRRSSAHVRMLGEQPSDGEVVDEKGRQYENRHEHASA